MDRRRNPARAMRCITREEAIRGTSPAMILPAAEDRFCRSLSLGLDKQVMLNLSSNLVEGITLTLRIKVPVDLGGNAGDFRLC